MAVIKLQSESDFRSEQHYEFDPENKSSILGRGGMGIVFEGKLIHNDTGKFDRVAIKVLFKDLSEESILRARREASIKIVHEHIIRMYDFMETVDTDGKPKYHIISEFVEGIALSEYLKKKGSLSWDEALSITKKILAGLYMLHEKGFVHRDIDPSNVMISEDGKKVKLIDFGIAKQIAQYHHEFQQGTMDGKFIGKPNYASPEQAKGNHWLTNATSDIYSVGILLFELLTGKLPYKGTTYEIIKGHLSLPIPVSELPIQSGNKKVSDGLKYIIKKATDKDQEKRYQTASGFISDIEKLLKGENVLPPAVPKWIYPVVAVVVSGLIFLAFSGGSDAKYLKAANRANDNLFAAKYEDALSGFKEAYSFKKADSILTKIQMLEVLTPAVAAYINSDYTKADSLFQIADSMNSSDAMYYLGEMCYEGIETPRDFKKGFKYTTRAAELGNGLAEYRLGLIYQNGIDMKVDKDKASRYFEHAGRMIDRGADADNPELLSVKGDMYLQGNGVAQNETLAFEFYEKAAKLDYPQAQFKLYELLQKKDNHSAMQWLTKSAERGYPKAQFALGDFLLKQKRIKEGFSWTERAAKKNYAPALRQLGAIYWENSTNIETNEIQRELGFNGIDSLSYKYFKLAVDFDPAYLKGRYALAVRLYDLAKEIKTKDTEKAKKYLDQAKTCIETLPYNEQNGRRVYDNKDYQGAEYIRTISLQNL